MRLTKHLAPELLVRAFADALIVNLALITAFILRFLGLVWLEADGGANTARLLSRILRASLTAYGRAGIVLTPLCLAVFYLSGFYTYGRSYHSRYKALVIFQAVTLAYLIYGAISYLFFRVAGWFPRSTWLMGWLLTLLLVGAVRLWAFLWRTTVLAEAKFLGKPATTAIRSVVVIGGAGYIGSVLTRQLLDQGYRVTVLDELVYGDEGIRELYGQQGFQVIHGDLRNIETVTRALQYADAVVHLGALVGDPACALDEKLTLQINLAATRMIAEAARGFGIQRFVFASTCSVYGASDELLDERSAPNPVSLYARTKIQSERLLLALNNDGFAPTILRFATVYGISPRPRFDLVVNLLAARAVCEKSIMILGGEQWRPFVHVADIAEAILECLQAPLASVKGQIFNVGSDEQNYQILGLGDLIKQLMPDVQVMRKGEDTDCRNYRVSFAKIRTHLGFTARHTVIDGIREIKTAILDGRIPDYRDSRYSNYRTLSEGNGHFTHYREMISLYADNVDDA